MPTNGKLSLDTGALAVRFDHTAYADAAVADDTIAGLEMTVTDANVYVGKQSDRRGDVTLTVSTSRAGLERLLYLLADKLELPAFTEPEWRRIAGTLRAVHGGDEINALAERIESALHKAANEEA